MIRILVVDDDGKVREVVAAMLAALGHTVLQAPDGLAAITMLEAKSAVDLVLTDLVMPGLSGWDLVKTIQRRWPLVRVAVVTGNHDIATAQAGQSVEFVIKKPFGLDTLQRVIGKGA
jgi:CheY-like chemotaxis protein